MTSEAVVTLRTGFRMAHGEFEEIRAKLKALPLPDRCIVMPRLLDSHFDETIDLGTNTGIQRLAEQGILAEENGAFRLNENVGEVLFAASGFTSKEEAQARASSCPAWRFEVADLIAG